MQINLSLKSLPIPMLTEALFHREVENLKEISLRNNNRFKQGYETKQYKNRKEELIQRLKRSAARGESFEKATDVSGRERLLLNLYIEYLGRSDAKSWLPDFDDKIARSVLGLPGESWHQARRRQVTMLFFTHFDRLTALQYLCGRLTESDQNASIRIWNEQQKKLFNPSGAENIAKMAEDAGGIGRLLDRFSIPKKGRFAEKLRQVILLNNINAVTYGQEHPAFEEIEKMKDELVSDNLMGAKALQIMVRRVAANGSRKWPNDWVSWITRFGCDPRYGRATAEGAKWWGWATNTELRLAQQGVTEITLRFFIQFLGNSMKGTGKEADFRLRSRFLMALFDAGKIDDSRLLLNKSALQRLPRQYHNPLTVALLLGTTAQTSMICLKCKNDIYIIEGTHSFGLRAFHRTFPLVDFWNRPRVSYNDSALRISPSDCPVFLRHVASGNWVKKFFSLLRSEFHIEWNDVNI